MCRNIRMRYKNIQQNGVAKAKPENTSVHVCVTKVFRFFNNITVPEVFIRQPSLFLMITQAARGAGERKELLVYFFSSSSFCSGLFTLGRQERGTVVPCGF